MNQLIIFFLAVVLSSMWCVGLHVVAIKLVFEEVLGIDFHALWDTQYVYKKPISGLPRWVKLILKPLFACLSCMASFWGTVIFWGAFSYMGFWLWIPFCICLCGLNYFVSQFFTD